MIEPILQDTLTMILVHLAAGIMASRVLFRRHPLGRAIVRVTFLILLTLGLLYADIVPYRPLEPTGAPVRAWWIPGAVALGAALTFFGTLRCIKAVLPEMLKRRDGRILNISSVAGRVALAPQAAYAASKHAIEAVSECLAQEIRAFNVRVVVIEPGPIATRMFNKAFPKGTGGSTTKYPHARRLGAMIAALLKPPTSPMW